MITAREYYQKIVVPTVDEFLAKNENLRLAMLACMASLHVVDYVFHNRCDNPKEADELVHACCEELATRNYAFFVVRTIGLAAKHCKLKKDGFVVNARYLPADTIAWARSQSGLSSDTIEGVYVDWRDPEDHPKNKKGRVVSMTAALKATRAFLEKEFPELTA
jgi:hypothetical protein